jgi:hypothetical protein
MEGHQRNQEKETIEFSNININLEDGSIDLEELNTNMNRLQHLYHEKCIEIEELRRRDEEHESIINAARQEFLALQQEYERLQRAKSSSGPRIKSENSGELDSLRQQVDELLRTASQETQLRQQNEQLLKEIERMEGERRKLRSNQNSQIDEKVQLLEEQICKKDQDIARLRQSNQLLQANCDELGLELEKQRLKYSNDFKSSENEKSELKTAIVSFEFKIAELERRIAGLEDVKRILTEQITSITTELHAKIDGIQKLETELRQERLKVKSFEADLQVHLSDTEENKLKLHESERKSQALIKSLQFELEKKKEESVAKANEVALLNSRITEL